MNNNEIQQKNIDENNISLEEQLSLMKNNMELNYRFFIDDLSTNDIINLNDSKFRIDFVYTNSDKSKKIMRKISLNDRKRFSKPNAYEERNLFVKNMDHDIEWVEDNLNNLSKFNRGNINQFINNNEYLERDLNGRSLFEWILDDFGHFQNADIINKILKKDYFDKDSIPMLIDLFIENGFYLNRLDKNGNSILANLKSSFKDKKSQRIVINNIIKRGGKLIINNVEEEIPLDDFLYFSTLDKVKNHLIDKYIENGNVNNFNHMNIIDNENAVDILQFLLKKGYDVNNCRNLNTVFVDFVMYGSEEVVDFLLKNGADVNASCNYNLTPIFYAIEKGKNGMLKILIENGADVNVENTAGLNPLRKAYNSSNMEALEILLDNEAKIDSRDVKGNTLLMDLSSKDNYEITEFFLKKGADVNAKNRKTGLTPLIIASSNGKLDNVKLFIKNGANINDVDKNGMTALMHASKPETTNLEIAEYLIQKGADPLIKDKKGKKALDYANMGK